MLPASATNTSRSDRKIERGVWSEAEHDKFLVGIKLYPKGPWKTIAEQIGTRSARQVQTHAQKYYEKVARRLRGLRKDRKKLVRPEHRLDDDMVTLCKVAEMNVSATAIGPIRNGLNAVHAIPKEIFALASEPANSEYIESALGQELNIAELESEALFAATYRQSRRDSIESLLEDDDDDDIGDADTAMSEYTDSDDSSESLLGFDDAYLDYLIEVLDASSCHSDGDTSD